MFLSVLIKCNI